MKKIYYCKKGDKFFHKGWAFEFIEKTVNNKKVFESTQYVNNEKPIRLYPAEFNNQFCKYTNQKLVLTSDKPDCAPLGKGSQMYRWISITALVLISLGGFIFEIFQHEAHGANTFHSIPSGLWTNVIAIALLIGLMEFWFFLKINDAKKNNIIKITFGATTQLKIFAFFESVITIIGGYYIYLILKPLLTAIFKNIVPIVAIIGGIVLVVAALTGFIYVNHKLQQKIIGEK